MDGRSRRGWIRTLSPGAFLLIARSPELTVRDPEALAAGVRAALRLGPGLRLVGAALALGFGAWRRAAFAGVGSGVPCQGTISSNAVLLTPDEEVVVAAWRSWRVEEAASVLGAMAFGAVDGRVSGRTWSCSRGNGCGGVRGDRVRFVEVAPHENISSCASRW